MSFAPARGLDLPPAHNNHRPCWEQGARTWGREVSTRGLGARQRRASQEGLRSGQEQSAFANLFWCQNMHVENERLGTFGKQGRNGTSEVGTRDEEVLGESCVPGVVELEAR